GPEGVKVIRSGAPAEDSEQDEEENDAQLGRDQVRHAGAADFLALALEGDEEKGSQRHDFPGDEKQDSVPRDRDDRHRGDEKVEEKKRGRELALSDLMPQITAAVDGGEAR